MRCSGEFTTVDRAVGAGDRYLRIRGWEDLVVEDVSAG
jgi:hypothetical protein